MLSMTINLTKLFIWLLVFCTFTSYSWAQTIPEMNYALARELGVEVIPTYPRPNENVSINLTLYTDDLNSADITWYKDGKKVLSGKGEVSYSFKTGVIGETTEIKININFLSGSSLSKSINFNPASVDLVWEANSYVPPFYRGKALHSRQGNLKIVAMSEFVKDGKRTDSKDLVYKWSNQTEVYQNQSGYGKNVLVLNGSLLGKSENVIVTVTDPLNNITAQGAINIVPTNPEIVFYENNPYYGHIFDVAINGTYDLKTEEIQIIAAPFYFTKDKNLEYTWRLNGQSVPNLAGSLTAVFRKPEEETAGRSNISLQIINPDKVLQEADKNLVINFKE